MALIMMMITVLHQICSIIILHILSPTIAFIIIVVHIVVDAIIIAIDLHITLTGLTIVTICGRMAFISAIVYLVQLLANYSKLLL